MPSLELLRKFSFFDSLKDDQVEALAKFTSRKNYSKGEIIFRENQPAENLCFLLEGQIELFFGVEVEHHPEYSKELFFWSINPGDVFSISALIEPYVLMASGKAFSDCEVIQIDSSKIQALCDQDPDLSQKLIRQLASSAVQRLIATRRQFSHLISP